MAQYTVSETYFFRETGNKVEAGGTVELTEEQAEAHNASHPGLLKTVRRTTQAHPTAVRDNPPAPATDGVQQPKKRRGRAAK